MTSKKPLWILPLLTAASQAQPAYPRMAPLDQYLMAQDAEIALARSAAPKSISQDAQILVLQPHGYHAAVPGTNGFVCVVQRSWTAGIDDPEFWNPKLRAPICFNPPAARCYLPLVIKKTDGALAGHSKEQISASVKIALDKKQLPSMETGAIGYMMSKEGNLNDHDGHWHPHLMFYVPETELATWGAGLPGAPLFGSKEILDRLTLFMIPVAKWSDGSEEHK